MKTSDLEKLERRISELEDRAQLQDLLVRYCRGVDRRDRELIESAFWYSSPDDFEPRIGGPRLADYMETFGDAKCHTHFIGNQYLEIRGSNAYGETYFVSIHIREGDDGRPVTAVRGGRYIDEFEKRFEEWRIARRFKIDDWDRLDPITKRIAGIGDHAGGARPADPTYEALASWRKRYPRRD